MRFRKNKGLSEEHLRSALRRRNVDLQWLPEQLNRLLKDGKVRLVSGKYLAAKTVEDDNHSP